MANARTRKAYKTRLESNEALTASERDGKGEAELPQAHLPFMVSTRKRKRGEVLEEQGGPARGTAAPRNDVEDSIPRKPSSVHDGLSETNLTAGRGKAAMGSSDPRAPTHQKGRKRGIHGARERARDSEIDRPAQNNISHDITGKEAEVSYEEKKGKRKVPGGKVRKPRKEEGGNAVSDDHTAAIVDNPTSLNREKKRRDILDRIYFPGQSSAEILSLAETKRTRQMARKDTDGEIGAGPKKKYKRFRSKGKTETRIIAEGESATADGSILREGESVKANGSVLQEGEIAVIPGDVPINGSKLGSSDQTAEFGREFASKSAVHVEESRAADVPNRAEPKPSKVSTPRKSKKIIAEVNGINESRGRLPKSMSPSITRGMKDKGLDPAGTAKGPPTLRPDPNSGGIIEDSVDQAAVPMTAVETAIMQLRNRKKVGEANLSERPLKRAKKKHSNAPADTDTRQKDVDITIDTDALVENRTANGNDGVGGPIAAATSDSQMNHTEGERKGSSSLKRVGEDDRRPQVLSTEGVVTRGSKIDGQSGNEQQREPALLSPVTRNSVRPIKGGAKNNNDEQETGQTRKGTEGNDRRGGRLGGMKKRGKKKIDPGGHLEISGVDSVLEKKASEPGGNGLQDEETNHCKEIKESGHLGPGPSNDVQTEVAEQRIVQNVDEVTVAEQSQKGPVELAEMREKTRVEKSMDLAEKNAGCHDIDQHHLASEILQGDSQDGEGRKLETVTPTEGPSKNTRGSRVDERNNTGPANNPVKAKLRKRKNFGRKQVDSTGLLKHPKSRIESSGLDSTPENAFEAGKIALQDEQTLERREVEEPGHLGHRPSSEVQTWLGEERVDVRDIGAETSMPARRLEQPSELHNVGLEEKIGVEKPSKLGEMDGGLEQIDHQDQVLRLPSDEGKDDRAVHTGTVIPRKLPVRTTGILTRGRKVDGQSRTGSEMESGLQPLVSGLSDQPSKGRGKKKSEAAIDKKALKTGCNVLQAEDIFQPTPVDQSVFASPESNKSQMELGEQRIEVAAGNTEKPPELRSKGSRQPLVSGLSDQPSKGRRKKKREAAMDKQALETGCNVLQAEDIFQPTPDDHSVLASLESNKTQMGLGEHTIEVAAGSTEKPAELHSKGSGQPLVSGLSDQPSKGRRKKTREAAMDKQALETGCNVPQAEDIFQPTPVDQSVLASPESNKIQMELGEQRIEVAAGSTEKPAEPQSKGSRQKKGIEPRGRLVETERRSKENDHRDQALEKRRVETQDVATEKTFEGLSSRKMSKYRPGRRALRRVREEDVSVKNAGLLKSSNGFTHVEVDKVSEDAGKRVELPAKRKWKKQGIGDPARPESENIVSPASAENTINSPELAENSLAASKGGRRNPKIVNKVTATDLQPPSEKTDPGLPIGVEDVNTEPYQGISCNEKAQGKLSNGLPPPKRRKTGRSRIVTSPPLVTTGDSEVVDEVGDPVKVKELSSGQGVDGDVIQSEDVVGRSSLLDDVAKVTVEASQVGLPIEDGNVHKALDQGETCKCDRENQQRLTKGSFVPNQCKKCRLQVVESTIVTADDGITSKDIPEEATVKHLSSELGVIAGIIQSERFEGRAESVNDSGKVAEKASLAGAEFNSQSSEAQGEATVKDLSSEHGVIAGIIQSEGLEGRAESLNDVEKVANKAPLAGAPVELNSQSEAQGEIQSDQVPAKKKKQWNRKDYRPKFGWEISTRARRQGVSNIEIHSDKNDTVVENGKVSPKEVVSTTENNRGSVSTEEIDVPKEHLEQGEKCPAAPDLPGECATDSSALPPTNEPKESSDSMPGEPDCTAAKVGQEIVESCNVPHVDERRSGLEDGSPVVLRTIERDLDVVDPMEVQKVLAPDPLGKDVCESQEVEKREEPRTDPTSHLNHFEEMKTTEQGKLDGHEDDQPESSRETLLSDQSNNAKVPGVLSMHPASPDGPFALEDGTSLKLHCGQEKTSSPDDHRDLDPEVAHSPSLERFSAEDFSRSITAHRAESISAPSSPSLQLVSAEDLNLSTTARSSESIGVLDKSECHIMVETSAPIATADDIDPVTTIVESESFATIVESESFATVFESESFATIVESESLATVESESVATESDPVATIVETGPVATIVASGPVATIVEADPVSTTVESDTVNNAEISNPSTTLDNSTGDIANSITTENVIESITPFDKPDSDSAGTYSDALIVPDKSGHFTSAIGIETIAAVEDSFVPLSVVNSEEQLQLKTVASEIGPVGESTVSSSDGKSSGGESLTAEAVNSPDDQVTVVVPSEVAQLQDDNSAGSPLVQPPSSAEDSVEPVTENDGMQSPGEEVTPAHCFQHSGTSDAKLDAQEIPLAHGLEGQVSLQVREPATTTSSPEDLCDQLSTVKDTQLGDECAEACGGVAGFQETLLEPEDFQQDSLGKAADVVQQDQPLPNKDWVGQSISDVVDSLQDAGVPLESMTEEKGSVAETEPSTSPRGGACLELDPSNCAQLESSVQKESVVESSDVRKPEQSQADASLQQEPRVALLDQLPLNIEAELGVGVSSNGDLIEETEQAVTSSPTAVVGDRQGVNCDLPTSGPSLEKDVTEDRESLEAKMPSGLDKSQQTQSEDQEPDDSSLKDFDVELDGKTTADDETKKVHAEVHEVPIEADIHIEAKQAHSKAEEMLAEVDGALTEAKEVNFNAEVNHVVELIQAGAQDVEAEVQQMQADVSEVQVEAPEMHDEVQSADGREALFHDSLNGNAGSVSVDTEGKEVDTEAKEVDTKAKEVQSESERQTELKEVDSEQEVDAEAKELQEVDTEAEEVQSESERQTELKEVDSEQEVDAEAKDLQEVDTEAEEVQSESERQTELKEVDSEQEVDAEAKDLVADEVTITSEHNKEGEGVTGLDNLVTTCTSEPHASNNCEPSLAVSVPEDDISMTFSLNIVLDLQSEPTNASLNAEAVTLDTEKHIQVAEQVSHTQFIEQDTAKLGHLASPVEAGGFVEGDALQSEGLSDVQTETHEKHDPKNQPPRKGSLVSKKRKNRTGIETAKEPEGGDKDEDLHSRLSSKKKGFLLPSTPIDSGGRRIRPRPLDPDQSLPIFVEGRDKDFYEYDGGAFYRWVQLQEEAKLKEPAVEPPGASEAGGSSSVSKADVVKKRSIFIPLFRKLPDDQLTNCGIVERLEQDILLGMQSFFPRQQAYVRHTKSAIRARGHALGGSFSTVPSVYDMDDDDDKWLQGYNKALEQSGVDQLLSDDAFEQLMELFEREFYRICQISQTPRDLGDGHRGKMSDVDSGKRHSRMESSRVLSLHERGLSPLQNGSDDCCICNGGENSPSNPEHRCQICSINVHESCYGICRTENNASPNWCCRKCEAVVGGRAISTISCAICCKPGGAMKPTVDPSKWAHVACALYTNETFFVDTEAMEPVDGLAAVEIRVKKQKERCGLCGAREGSCVRCSTRGCRAPFHISCGVSQGASFELRHTKQQVVGVRSYCPRHASIVPGANLEEGPSRAGDAGDLLPAVSTESSDTLEMRQVEQRSMVENGNGSKDAAGNGGWGHVSSTSNPDGVDGFESRRFMKKKRSETRPRVTSAGGATPSKLDSSSRPHETSEKDVHGVSRTLPRSGSMLKENLQGLPQYMDETDPYLRATDEDKLDSEAVSAATSGCSSHLTSTFENLDHTGKAARNTDEVDLVNVVGKDKSTTGDAETSSLAEKAISDAVSPKVPSLETLDTNLAPPQIVKAVYSFWQSKRVKAKGPILHDLRQLHAARSHGIFNKVVNRRREFPPAVGQDSPARIPVRRPRSVARDPVSSRFSEMRQQLDTLRSLAGSMVRREQLKLVDQKCLYEIARKRLQVAGEQPRTRRCLWCEKTQNLLSCSSCPKAFCFQCFKHRRGYGVKGWIAASKLPKYVCNFCSGSLAQDGPDLRTNALASTFSEPRGTPVSRVAPVPGRLRDWNYGLEVRTKPNSGKQVSFLNDTTWQPDPPGSSSSTQQEVASTMAPGRGKMMFTGQSTDGQAAHTNFTVPSPIERSRAVHRGGVLSPGPNDPDGMEGRQQPDHPHGEGKKVKRRRVKMLEKQTELQAKTVLRATKRIKKLARSSSFVYGSDDEATVSESDESRTDKKTVKLSDLRDKAAESQCTNLLEAGAERNTEKGYRPLKYGIKLSSTTGKLILRRHGSSTDP